ncbi:MAG: acyltransferase [Polyangiaceae bacterium]|nr:acyltransferase [Polyangiaceae bacterium]
MKEALTRENANGTKGPKLAELECLRGLAAFYVFLHHYVRRGVPELPILVRFFSFGQVAVMLFFLVSGFVIHLATRSATGPFQFFPYLLRRIRRIYPPYLIALLLTWVCWWVVPINLPFSFKELAGNALMLQGESGTSSIKHFLDNYPLWSLSYEFWFYVLYGLLVSSGLSFEQQRRVTLVVTALATIVDLTIPNQAARFISYFPLWWVGVELAELYEQSKRIRLRSLLPALSVLALPFLARALDLLWRSGLEISVYGARETTVRRFVTVALLLSVGLVWQRFSFRGFWPILGVFRWLAPISYALYVTHAPVLRIAVMSSPIRSGLLNFLWICPLVLAVAWVIEVPIQNAVNRAFPLRPRK